MGAVWACLDGASPTNPETAQLVHPDPTPEDTDADQLNALAKKANQKAIRETSRALDKARTAAIANTKEKDYTAADAAADAKTLVAARTAFTAAKATASLHTRFVQKSKLLKQRATVRSALHATAVAMTQTLQPMSATETAEDLRSAEAAEDADSVVFEMLESQIDTQPSSADAPLTEEERAIQEMLLGRNLEALIDVMQTAPQQGGQRTADGAVSRPGHPRAVN